MNKLVLHSSVSATAANQLRVFADAEVRQSKLVLSYRIESAVGAPKLVWPENPGVSELSSNDRQDELWKDTCLEAFLLLSDGKYIEFNFSPAGKWNAYHFDSYRTGMKSELRITHGREFISKHTSSGGASTYELFVEVDLAQAVKSPQNFRLGLTAVIETVDGERSYWSLKHSGEKPDFHDSRGYTLEMRI